MLTQLGVPFFVKESCGFRNGKGRQASRLWAVFLCPCGSSFPARVKDVQNDHTTTCGCSKLHHGHKRRHNSTSTYLTWCSMLQRCNNEDATSYFAYGAVGISVCESWYVFENFLADMGLRPPGTSLDRINNDGDYCKENCRWATPHEQANNRKNCHKLTIAGETLTLHEWAKRSGTKHDTIYSRYKKGWSPEEAVYGRNK